MQFGMPTTFADWVALALRMMVVAVTVAGFLWKVIKAPLETQVNGLGGRVKILEDGRTHDTALVDKHDRSIERIENAMIEGQGRVARIEGSVERLIVAIERNRDANIEEDSEIRERLVRIETKLDAMQQKRKP